MGSGVAQLPAVPGLAPRGLYDPHGNSPAVSDWFATLLVAMPNPTAAELSAKKCVPCEGGVPKLSSAEAEAHLAALPAWKLTHDGGRFRLCVDGGISTATVGPVAAAGAELIVAGSAVINSQDYARAIRDLEALARGAT